MSRSSELSAWVDTLSTNMPNLSRPQAFVLAAWSFALVLAQTCALTTCAAVLAELWQQPHNTVRQRLREWCYEKGAKAGHKRGVKRTELDVKSCFAPLLRWVVSYWPASHPYLALALDASLLGTRFAVLSCCVLYRGCAIPVAWKVVAANQKGAWRPHWLSMLAALDKVVPSSWTVLVLADRGLYAKWLYRAIEQNGWHPFLRIQRQGKFRLSGQAHWHDLHELTPKAQTCWVGQATCFKAAAGRLECTLLGRWEQGQDEPWLIVTDLAECKADSAWYGLRSWIECGFKDIKSGGWKWQQSKMSDVGRAERLWLVLAVATLWVVSNGGAAEATSWLSGLEQLAAQGALSMEQVSVKAQQGSGCGRRQLSCFRRGIVRIVVGLLHGQLALPEQFWPQEWPQAAARGTLSFTQLAAAAPAQAAAA